MPVAYPIGQEVAGGWRTEYLEWDKNECLVVLTEGNEMYTSLNKFTVNIKPSNIHNLRRQRVNVNIFEGVGVVEILTFAVMRGERYLQSTMLILA